jgi:hypothetical protein
VIQEEILAPEVLLLLLLVVSAPLFLEQFDCTDNNPASKKLDIKKLKRIKEI